MAPLSELVASSAVRIALFVPAAISVLLIGLRTARNIARVEGRRVATSGRVNVTQPSRVERLRDYVQWGNRSEWGRKDLVGRLRVTARRLYRCAPPTANEIANDEAAFEALLEEPELNRRSHGSGQTIQTLRALISLWEKRIYHRPAGGE